MQYAVVSQPNQLISNSWQKQYGGVQQCVALLMRILQSGKVSICHN